MDIETSKRFLEMSRFWVQRILVPILVFVGVGGNVVTVMVLTRRRMRCSTNIYLTALAVTDLVYLLFVLVLSFEHYPNINDIRYGLYWRFYGINHWLADAASSTSIWLVVCFTIERYIAVCHPIRGKVLCTENRAKRVIAAVSILCILATISTSFEYQLTTSLHFDPCPEDYEDTHHTVQNNHSELLNISSDNILPKYKTENVDKTKQESSDFSPGELAAEKSKEMAAETIKVSEGRFSHLDDYDLEFILLRCLNDTNHICTNSSSECRSINEELVFSSCNSSLNGTEVDCYVRRYRIETEPTNLGQNVTYKTVFYWFTTITFIFLPLTLIATFNCFLVNSVRKSQKQRRKMTKSQENSTQANEHRMTLILIAVVVLFLICQTPSACILIYTSIYPILDFRTENLVRGLGNVFNLLVSINAACNFLLYCALSEKYRRTFKALFCGRRVGRQDTSYISSISRQSQRPSGGNSTDGTQKNGFRRNLSAYVPRNYQTQSLNSIPRAQTVIVRPAGQKTLGKLV